jgi:glycerophosphoryl diester phosphodiesterase
MTKFTNIGHRGAAAYSHENTLASLEEGIHRHADALEFDVRRTADGILVLCHNWTAKVLSGNRKSISKITYPELHEIAESREFNLATFEEVLNSFGSRIPLNIEIKAGGYEADVIAMIHRYPLAYTPTLSSFFPWVIRRIKNLKGDIRTALILGQERVVGFNIMARPVIERLVTTLGIGAIHLQEAIATAAVIDKLSRLGVTVFVWTVDDPERMRALIKMGVDGIVTNRSDVLYNTCLEMANVREPILRRINSPIGRFAYAY